MITYYLEMLSSDDLNEKAPAVGLEVRKCKICQWEFNRFLYHLVGTSWDWVDKLSWTDTQWQNYVCRDKLHTWVAYFQGTPAGYYELEEQENQEVKIAYFGLAPPFIGHGFGGYLLSHAIKSAWQIGEIRRVWVHTCSADHPAALANYKARGMTLYQVLSK